MMVDHRELEIKFLVKDLKRIESHLIDLKADLLKARCLEQNYRLDTKENKLTSDSKVLRIRKEIDNWITYKEPGPWIEGIRSRREIEFSVHDIEAAQSLLISLGFQIFQTYEKYRTEYTLNDTKKMLDELPMGNFIEIETEEVNNIKKIAEALDLRWELKIECSYLAIFNDICRLRGHLSQDLTFDTISVDYDAINRVHIFPAD